MTAPGAEHAGGTDCVVVQTTVAGESDAQSLARGIVAQRLAACVQVEAIRSVYRWQGNIEEEPEFRLTAKTRACRSEELADFISRNHGYETPEILILPVLGGSPAYLQWVAQETAAAEEENPNTQGEAT